MEITKKFINESYEFFKSGARKSIRDRKLMLKNLKKILKDNREKIFIALYEDLHKSEAEAIHPAGHNRCHSPYREEDPAELCTERTLPQSCLRMSPSCALPVPCPLPRSSGPIVKM